MSALDDLLLKKYRETVEELPSSNDASPIQDLAQAILRSPTSSEPDETISIAAETVDALDTELDKELDNESVEAQTPSLEESILEDEVEVEDAKVEATTEESAVARVAPVEIPIDFKPDWEIDRFPWPAICGEIEERVASSELEQAIRRITDACEQRACNTMIITSAHSGCGRTTMTLCLAREAARNGLTVAIVDLDHAEPSMLERMSIEFEQGIESLHESGVSTESICVTAVEDGVSLIPTAKAFEPAKCNSDETRKMLHTVAKHHDLVLIDASREVADLIAGAKDFPAQGVIMINDPAAGEATQAFLEWIQEKDAWTLGIIENFAA